MLGGGDRFDGRRVATRAVRADRAHEQWAQVKCSCARSAFTAPVGPQSGPTRRTFCPFVSVASFLCVQPLPPSPLLSVIRGTKKREIRLALGEPLHVERRFAQMVIAPLARLPARRARPP